MNEYASRRTLGTLIDLPCRAMSGGRNLVLRSLGQGLKPRRIWFEVTDNCNSRCTHCSIWRRKSTLNFLTPREIEQTLSDPLFNGLEAIVNSGGEPSLREDIEEILLIEHKLFPNAILDLSTNGLRPERVIEVARTMIKHNVPLEIGISLDGIGDIHDLQRGVKGNFAKVDFLLRELVSMRDNHSGLIKPCTGFVLSRFTTDYYEEVRAYAESIKVPLSIQWYNESSFYDNVGTASENHAAEKEKMRKIVQSLPKSLINEKWVNWLEDNSIRFRCFAMHMFCVLKCNGDIVPCLNWWDTKVGNVRENSPTQIWHSLETKMARQVVGRCQGCLNSWGVLWSALYSVYPNWFFYLRHADVLSEKLKRVCPNSKESI